MRKLATIYRVDTISEIPNADAIDVATVGGWKVVVKKGEYSIGDTVVYVEVDSWVPTELAPFLSKGQQPREFEGIKGERLRTVKLRGQLSQGLLLPTSVITQDIPFELGADVSELLGITKWEPTLSANLVGIAKGAFPAFVPKTDQERCQNLVSEIRTASYAQEMFEATEKLEGTSATFYVRDKQFGVCSRNLELEYDENNSLWVAAKEFDLENKLLALGKDIAVQGELVGPGIQKNIYGLKDVSFYVFDIYDIREGKYLRPEDRKELAEELCLPHVPVIGKFVLDDNIDTMLAFADGTSALANTAREGVVFKSMNSNFNFKAISNKYLLKCKPD